VSSAGLTAARSGGDLLASEECEPFIPNQIKSFDWKSACPSPL
jgi:hypothetical protein